MILDLLTSNGKDGVSLAEVSQYLGLSKSTAHRYLITLEELSVVERNERNRFRLGPKLIELGGAFLNDNNLRNLSEPFLNELAAQTQETVHLAIPLVNEVVFIAKVDSPHSVRMASHIGIRMPMYCTSLGKAILAHYSFSQIEEIISAGMPARTPHTITSAQALRTELERVRAQGFAIDDQGNELGVRCGGAPIFDYTTKVIGAISISGPAYRLSITRLEEFSKLVLEAAKAISSKLGYIP